MVPAQPSPQVVDMSVEAHILDSLSKLSPLRREMLTAGECLTLALHVRRGRAILFPVCPSCVILPLLEKLNSVPTRRLRLSFLRLGLPSLFDSGCPLS